MESHLLQMRGLKLQLQIQYFLIHFVASFTDAWIETGGGGGTTIDVSRIFYRCVD